MKQVCVDHKFLTILCQKSFPTVPFLFSCFEFPKQQPAATFCSSQSISFFYIAVQLVAGCWLLLANIDQQLLCLLFHSILTELGFLFLLNNNTWEQGVKTGLVFCGLQTIRELKGSVVCMNMF